MASNMPRLQRRALFNNNARPPSTTWQASTSSTKQQKEPCNCVNPSCKLFHGKLYKGQNENQIDEIFDELQKKSKGKIESLAELINKLRGLGTHFCQ